MRIRNCCGITLILLLFVVAFMAAPTNGQTAEIPLGSPMPADKIQLIDESGKNVTLADVAGSASTVILFWSNRCPWTSRYQDRISKLHNDLSDSDNVIILINSNDGAAFPDENAAASAEYFKANRIASHYLTDAASAV
ncbi:MAG: redoxin domain-containing protein, partial [Rhodothermia bacterium]|nr:redoxin domain-containing protein [Rhodothermia bacterium]